MYPARVSHGGELPHCIPWSCLPTSSLSSVFPVRLRFDFSGKPTSLATEHTSIRKHVIFDTVSIKAQFPDPLNH